MQEMRFELFVVICFFIACNNKKSPYEGYLDLYKDEVFAQRRIQMDKVSVGSTFPDDELFTLKEHGHSKYFLKSPCKIYFWASWCSPCMKSISMIDSLSIICSDNQQSVYIVSIEDDIERWKQLLEERELSGNHYWMGNNAGSSIYSVLYDELEIDSTVAVVTVLPKIIEIDGQRRIATKSRMFRTEEELRNFFSTDCVD